MQHLDNQSFTPPIFPTKYEILTTLTCQELKTLKLAATDLTNKEIGDQMCISDKTAKKHRQNTYEKLNIRGKCTIRKFLKYFEALF